MGKVKCSVYVFDLYSHTTGVGVKFLFKGSDGREDWGVKFRPVGQSSWVVSKRE